jgi:hypothetical protein
MKTAHGRTGSALPQVRTTQFLAGDAGNRLLAFCVATDKIAVKSRATAATLRERDPCS